MKRTGMWAGAALGLVLAAGGTVAVGGGTGGALEVIAQDEAPGRVDPALVAKLTVDGMPPLACGFAPIDVLAAEPGIEQADTAESRGLREIIASTQGSMSPQDPKGWVEMWRKGNTVEYGRRIGAVGISYVLGVERKGDEFTFGGSFSCGAVGYPNRGADRADVYVDRGDHLQVGYVRGDCDARPDEVRVYESEEYVDVLLLSPPQLRPETACVDAGPDGGTVKAPLRAPLAGRTVRNIGYIPPVVIVSQAEEDARNAAEEARNAAADPARREGERLCRRAADETGKVVSIAWASNARSVRASIPEARQLWPGVPDDAVTGDCYLANPDGSLAAVVIADGGPAIVWQAHQTSPPAPLPGVDG